MVRRAKSSRIRGTSIREHLLQRRHGSIVAIHPSTPAAIDELLRGRLLPHVTDEIREKHGWEYYYYGNLPWRNSTAERDWYTFDHRPRFSNNYGGLRNRFGILSEAYAYATFEERVLATLYFVEEIVDFAQQNAGRILAQPPLTPRDPTGVPLSRSRALPQTRKIT